MSVNQSRGDKNEPAQYRRLGRSGNPVSQRNFSGGGGCGGKGGGGSGSTAPPSSSSFYSSRSFKKVVNNAQGAQPRVSSPNANVSSDSSNSSAAGRLQNGTPIQPTGRGTPDAPLTGPTVRSTDVSSQKSTPGLPKAPQGNVATPSSGAAGPATPAKGSADASRVFPLQFGSISPGVMNGMQIPARTNSAPPNLDEQKQVQARIDYLKATSYPTPAVPKQQLPRKDAGPVDESNASESHPIEKDKKDVPASVATASTQTQKSSGHHIPPIPGVSMQMPFHQSQLHLQFVGPNPQMQSQGIANTSLPMPLPMPLPMGNPPQVQQQVFVPGIQHHPMQSQGIIRQGQGMNFSSQMGPPQLPPQLGNMGMGLGSQYQQQQMGKFGGPRRAVKITHPDTHEELRLDKRTNVYADSGSKGPRSHLHGPPQSQAVSSFPPARPMNYYSNSYNGSSPFFPPSSSNPLTSAQITPGSLAPRFYNQVTVKPAAIAHGEKVVNSSLPGSLPANDKSEIAKIQRAGGDDSSVNPQTDAEAMTGSSLQQSNSTPIPVSSKPSAAAFVSFQSENLTANSISSASPAPVEDYTSLGNSGVEVTKRAAVNKSGSFKEEQKKQGKMAEFTPLDQVGGQPSSISSTSLGHHDSVDTGVRETLKGLTFLSGTNEGESETGKKVVPTTVTVNVPGSSASKCDGGEEGLTSIKMVGSEINSDSSLKVEGSKAEIVGSKERGKDEMTKVSKLEAVDQNKDSTVLDVTTTSNETRSLETAHVQRKVPVNNRDGKSVTSISSDEIDALCADNSSLNLSSSHGDKVSSSDDCSSRIDSKGADNVDTRESVTSDQESLAVSVPEAQPSSSEAEGTTSNSTDLISPSSSGSSDIAEVLIVSNNNVRRESYPSPGRAVDRSAVGSRLDCRPSNVGDDEKWSKVPGHMGSGRDMRLDIGFPGNVAGFRPGHGANYGVLRNPRAQAPIHYEGGVLSGPLQSPGAQGGPQRHNSDSDRWQRATGYQKGLIPSPQTPMQVMHKAERKYEVGKVTDEEQAEQMQLKGILNKLTPQNFENVFEEVKQVNIDNAGTLSGVCGQIFDKALMEPTFCEMYANFCSRLAFELPDFRENNERITFKGLLLNKCQEVFERGEREQEEANKTEEEGEVKQSEEEREEKRVTARRRMLGNIRLIGELYKKKMLTERVMHECIKKLLGQYQNPDEEDIEALCKLMSTIGEMIDHPKAKEHMDVYFDTMSKLSNNMKLSSRVRFMLEDVMDLRKNKWQQRRKVEGPKKIEEVHRDAAQERQAQSSRLARGSSLNMSLRRGQPVDFGPRGSNVLPSPNAQMGGFRGLPQQLRGYGNQDARFEGRYAFENRTLSVPLRPIGDETITLGPQRGLARGMSIREQPSMQGMPLPEMPNPTDSRRVVAGPNGYGSMSERASHGPRFAPRPAYDQSNIQELDLNYVNRDMRNAGRNFDRVPPSSPPSRGRVLTPPQSVSSDKVLSEDRLHDMSIETIKEFYRMDSSSSASSNSNTTGFSLQSDVLKRKSNDIGWEYGELINPNDLDKVKCKLCGKSLSGGIYRLNQHIACVRGSVTSCPKATPLDKNRCKEAMEHFQEVREAVNMYDKEMEDDDEVDEDGNKARHTLGPIDQFAKAIDTDSSVELRRKVRQQNINDALFKNKINEVHAYLARWVYESGVAFDAINNDSFHRFVEAVGQFGPGYIPPSQYQLRGPLLKQEVDKTKQSLKKQEEEWKKSGCSFMTDVWSDRKRRSIMNLCVNCKAGTCFISSIEASNEAYTAEYIFEYVDKYIDEVGPHNVIQVVTDNASNNMAAVKILKEKRPYIFWSSCATHTINLILEGIGKLPKFKSVIDKAKALTQFIYSHHKTLALMRKFTKRKDIVRPGVTRFASSFLTMESILEQKEKLKFMFLSEEWGQCKCSTSAKGIKAYATIVSQIFWTNLAFCVEIFKPLVKVLRLVDGDCKPSMGFVYGELKDAKREIMKICKDVEATYKPILEIIDSKGKDRLDSPLHLAGYLLNPYYYYRDNEVEKDPNCMDAMMTCIEAFFPDELDKQHLVFNVELLKYKRMEGMFSKKLAIMGRARNDDTFDPVGWWSNYGGETPNLRMIAMKILSLTTSSSGCKRTWSTFEGIHTKKRNRLDAERLNNLVYVQFNAKLVNKKKKTNEKYDSLLANDACMAQAWIVEGGDDEEETSHGSGITWDDIAEATGAGEFLEPRRSARNVRELDEDNFESDDEETNNE